MSEQTQPETALQALAEKLRTDAIAIFGEGQAERDIIEWLYAAMLAAAPAPVVPDGYVLVPVEPTAEMMMHESSCQHHAADDMSCPVRRTRRNIWARMLAAAPAHPAERQDKKPLDERMRAAGMMTVADRLAGAPLDAFIKHAGVNDLSSLLQWAEMRRADWLKMQASYDLGERDKSDELYEWTIAHCAVFTELHVNIRAALAGEKERQDQGEVQRLRLVEMIDAAMVEMQNISPPLRRSECERLIRAALAASTGQEVGK